MQRDSKASRGRRWLLALSLIFALVGTATVFFDTTPAQAQTEEELQAQKDEWQGRYRLLLQNAARLKENSRRSREDYARAQRRNYPRGGARQKLILQAEQAETELAAVQQETEALRLDARRQGIMPGWLYQVDDEPIVIPEPAAPDSNASDDGEYTNDADYSDEVDEEYDDREGRNPLYFEDNSEDASEDEF